ncbi:MAG: high-potential iron-sulfur protein [Burkholderiales bacterium]
MNKSRRSLLAFVPAAGVVLLTGRAASAQPARVDEKDANAVALAYKHDATAVDTKKYGQYVKGSICANCTLYAGKASDPWAPCGVLGGKQVNAKGWCVAYVKKA